MIYWKTYYLAAPLVIANGTLGGRGTPVGNHCSNGIILLLLVRTTVYGVILRAHPVCGESHIQRNANGEVATIYAWVSPK